MWGVLAPFFYHCGNFTNRKVSSHLRHSLHRSTHTPSNKAPPPRPSCIEPSLPMITVWAFSPYPSALLRSPGSCLLWAPSLWEALSLIVGTGPCTLTCLCSDPLESTGTTHQWPGAEQLYQLNLWKLKYPVILAAWSLKLSPTYYSQQKPGASQAK